MRTDEVVDLIDVGVAAVDREGRITLWNRWLEERSRRRREEVLGQVLWEVCPDLQERGLDTRIRDTMATGQPQVISPALHGYLFPLPGATGEPMAQAARVLPLRERGQVTGALITLQDMSAIIQAETQLLRTTEHLRLLQESAGNLAARRSLEETLQAIADRALEALEAQAVLIFVRDEQAGGLYATAKATLLGVERLEETMQRVMGRRIAEFVVPLSHTENPLVRAATTGQPLIGARIAGLAASRPSRLIFRALKEALGVEAVTILPLQVADRVVGVMIFDSPAREQISSHDQALYAAFAHHAAVAIENARLFAGLQREHATLERQVGRRASEFQILFELSERLGRALTYDDFFRSVLEAVDRALSPDLCGILAMIEDEIELWIYQHAPLSPGLNATVQEQALQAFRGIGGQAITVEHIRLRLLPAPDYDPQAAPLEGQVYSIFAPLVMRGQTGGLIQACSLWQDALGAQDVRLLHAVAYQAALAVQLLQALLERERSLLQTMVESMADGMILLDETGQLVAANSLGQALHAHLCRCDHGRACPLHELLADMLAGQNGAVDREFEVEERFYVARATPAAIPLAGETVRGVVITLRDVTEQHIVQEQLFQTSKLAAIGELAAGVAHELNNPLTVIVGFSELLLLDAQEEETRAALQQIREQGLHARDIVQNLLSFARSQRLAQEVVDLNTAIKQAVDLVGRQLELDGVQVVQEYDSRLPRIVGDAGQLQQVVLNLLQNAHDAIMLSHQGSRVVVRTRRLDEDRVAFEVEDDGPGIPEDILGRIFNPFFTTKPPGKGTGLGLSISHKIVQKHDGQIIVSSRPGSGTRFTVELPLRQAAEPSLLARPSEERPRGPALRSLAVDDEPAALEVISRMLQQAGHQVDGVTRGQEALERLAEQDYDVIVLDLKMPDLSGQEVYRRLRAEHPELARRVLFVSGVVIDEAAQAFLNETGQPALSKPFSQDDLLAAVGRVVGGEGHNATQSRPGDKVDSSN